jgi:hypothetical protein
MNGAHRSHSGGVGSLGACDALLNCLKGLSRFHDVFRLSLTFQLSLGGLLFALSRIQLGQHHIQLVGQAMALGFGGMFLPLNHGGVFRWVVFLQMCSDGPTTV